MIMMIDEQVLQEPYAEIERKMHLLLQTGQMLMESGADTNRIVRDMKRVAAYMGIPKRKIHLHITCTTIMLNISDGDHSYTQFRKCQHHSVNMTVISALIKLSWHALERNYTLDEYEAELMRIRKLRRNYSPLLSVLGAGLACGSFGKLFGCDWAAFFWTMICASSGFWVRSLCNKWGVNPYAGISIAAFVATFLAYLTQFISGSVTPWYPMIACTLFIIPGIPLINAVDDMLNNYIAAGTTRSINTLLIVASMTFGIILAIRIANVADFTTLNVVPDSIYLSHAIFAAIAAAGFSIIFNVPPRLLIMTVIGGIISVCLRNFFAFELGMSQVAGSFIGAVVVGLITMKSTHWLNTSAYVLSIPSVIPLIPGVLLYRLLFAIINIKELDTVALLVAIQNGVTAVLIIISVAVGITIPNLIAQRYLDKTKDEYIEELIEDRRQNIERDLF